MTTPLSEKERFERLRDDVNAAVRQQTSTSGGLGGIFGFFWRLFFGRR